MEKKKFKRRFLLAGHMFRITKVHSYGRSYEAFCKGRVDIEKLMGQEVKLENCDLRYVKTYKVFETSSRIMPCGKDKHIERTYVVLCQKEDGFEYERQARFLVQRNSRGFDDSETWNLDAKILEFLVPRLKAFAKAAEGHRWPAGIDKKDGGILYVDGSRVAEEMLDGFRLCQERDDRELTKRESAKVNRAFNLFKKHFGNLWT